MLHFAAVLASTALPPCARLKGRRVHAKFGMAINSEDVFLLQGAHIVAFG